MDQAMGTKRERVMEELVQGKGYATQLQLALREPAASRISADELLGKILRSFMDTLSVLAVPLPIESSAGEVVSAAASPANGSGCSWGDRCDSGDSTRKSNTSSATPGRRGCYKRKKKSEAWTIISSAVEDGHAWRKYGQKEILNSKFPRSYFRCTRKYEDGCKATKQVQKVEDDPHMYRTTYIGHHSCKGKAPPPLISDATKAPIHVVKAEDTSLAAAGDVFFSNNNNDMWSDLGTFGSGEGGLDHIDLVDAFGFDRVDQCGFGLDDASSEYFLLGKFD